MKALIIGGTGTISTAVTARALETGFDVTILNRGNQKDVPEGVHQLHADVRDRAVMEKALAGSTFDVVCDYLTFNREQARQDIELFGGRAGQYLFISSATVYQKPPVHYLVTEGTPLGNPFSEYARNKIACEMCFNEAYRTEGFPVTIVRPSYTYGDSSIPWALNSKTMRYSIIHRLRAHKPIVVPGDGTSFWTLTHNTDFARAFVGLMGKRQAVGHAFHITGDEAMTWDAYLHIIAGAIGEKAEIAHIASDAIARRMPEQRDSLIGDKAQTAIFDNTKIKTFVPGFVAAVPFETGIRRTLAWYESHRERQDYDMQWDAVMDELVEKYGR
jgi:nucleoside-diphosphate-sugar epimerase